MYLCTSSCHHSYLPISLGKPNCNHRLKLLGELVQRKEKYCFANLSGTLGPRNPFSSMDLVGTVIAGAASSVSSETQSCHTASQALSQEATQPNASSPNVLCIK